jgi:hypothetical protein
MTKEQLEDFLAEGLSLEQIGKRVGCDPSTVSHHLTKHGLVPVGHQVHAPNRVTLACSEHGLVEFHRRPDGNYRCSKCRTASVSAWRRRVKRKLIERAGGRCVVCGYDRHPSALHFHHVDPTTKSFILSRHGVTRSFREAAAEADKCVLLCGNCHAEVEAGLTALPDGVLPLQLAERRAS